MKKMKKIVAAAMAMMTFSTAAAVTGTVAWFTASNVVVADGMNIQADTEEGLLIANEKHDTDADWKAKVSASHTGAGYKFIPTSTYNGTNWYHANSEAYDDHAASGAYAELTTSVDGTGTGIYCATIANQKKDVFLLNSFFVKSSSIEVADQTLYVNSITVTGESQSVDLDKSLRVLIVYNSNYKFFAPYETGSELVEYTVGGTSNKYIPVGQGVKNTELATGVTIPANNTGSPLELKVYIYFEGEDKNCKSSNIEPELDSLSLSIQFGTETIA